MKSEIILHIGLTKTGTSSIQRFLSERVELLYNRGLIYPQSGRARFGATAHHNLAYELLDDSAEVHGRFLPERGGWADALAEIDKTGTGIISTEALSKLDEPQIGRLKTVLAGRSVRIVVYLRRQDLRLHSHYNQRARFGRVDFDVQAFLDREWPKGQYDETLSPWMTHFPDVDIHIYDTIGGEGGTLAHFVSHYAPGVVLPQPDESWSHGKAGIKFLFAVQSLVSMGRLEFGDDYALSQRAAMKLSDYFHARPDEVYNFSAMGFSAAQQVMECLSPSNKRLHDILRERGIADRFPQVRVEDYRNYLDLASVAKPLDAEEDAWLQQFAQDVMRGERKSKKSSRAVLFTGKSTES
jgi:hypothetical protein